METVSKQGPPECPVLAVGLYRPSDSELRHRGSLKRTQTRSELKHCFSDKQKFLSRGARWLEAPWPSVRSWVSPPSGCSPSSHTISSILKWPSMVGEGSRTEDRCQQVWRTELRKGQQWAGEHAHILYFTFKVAQLCLALCNPMDCTVHGILQVRILEWVAFHFSRGSSQPRDQT